ncbi:hypothetical protein LXL04_017819 [Taraxacum kok-saghyz]
MADLKEDDGASKSNSNPKEENVSTTSKDEGNTTIFPELDQGHNTQDASTKIETDEAQAIKENAIIQKNKEKMEEQIKVVNTDLIPKGKGRKPRKRNKKKVAKMTSEIVIANNGVMITEENNNGDKLPESSNKRKQKLRRNRAKKVAPKGSDMVAVGEDNPEPSTKKKVESMGMVFMCSSKTKSDCFKYKILGLPAGKKDDVAKIYKGMRLFLFDVDLKLMYGIFKAAGEGGYNIEPKAFKSAFPSQVRFTVMEDCLPLAEETFRKIIKENYYTRNKFNCQLNSHQVKKLCKVFVARKINPSPKMSIKSHHQSGSNARDRGKHKRKEQRRYGEYGGPPGGYQQEAAHLSPVRHVARYLPEEVGSYRYPVLEHRPYHVLDTDNHHRLYSSREAPVIYRDRMAEYHDHHYYQPPEAAMLPSQYHLVRRELYPHDISGGGLQVRGNYGDAGKYFSSSRYGY